MSKIISSLLHCVHDAGLQCNGDHLQAVSSEFHPARSFIYQGSVALCTSSMHHHISSLRIFNNVYKNHSLSQKKDDLVGGGGAPATLLIIL